MNVNFKKFAFIFCLFVFVFSLSGCKFVNKETREAMKPVTLNYWRVYDDSYAFSDLLNAYRQIHPNITVNYRKLTYDEYEKELLEAFAEGRGPDIFSIHNTWMTKYKSKLLPVPSSITLPYTYMTGSIKKEEVIELRTTPSITIDEVKASYLPVVVEDVIMRSDPDPETGQGAVNQIYGLPLSVDTMVMYYNRDILNNAGIPGPPVYWDEFQQAVKTITRIDRDNNITQSAAAFGTADNIDRFFDILSLLMIQNGTQMYDAKGNIAFHTIPPKYQSNQPPAVAALQFYIDFASPIKAVYTWNNDFPNSLDAFLEGKTAFFFGYAYHLPMIKANELEFKYGIANMPQIKNNPSVNYANYWVEVVSDKTENVNEAWDFVQFITKAEQAQKYLDYTTKPTALKDLINAQLDDLELGVFAEQLLTAVSWYKGYNSIATEDIFQDLVNNALQNSDIDLTSEMTLAAQKVTQTLKDQ